MTVSSMRHANDASARVELNAAIDGDELFLQYQPIVDLWTGVPVGAEALVRWHHPQLGVLGPDAFVPLAESSDLIRQLDDWVLAEACTQLALWEVLGGVPDGFNVAVNLSPTELDGAPLVARVQAAVTRAEADPRRLTLEVTESHRLEDIGDARVSVDGIHDLGCRVSLDDFGAEYASFSRLRALPWDVIKIDRHVTALAETKIGASLVGALVELASSTGASVVGEGIETCELARLARDLGCDLGQGYLWAPALAPACLQSLVAAAHGAFDPDGAGQVRLLAEAGSAG